MTFGEALLASGLPPSEARLLLAHAAGCSIASVSAHPERELAALEARGFLDAAARRRAGEPAAYILGRREFFGLDLEVNRAVLVPRPETELLVELALEKGYERALDLGTGSGAIAIALQRSRPAASVVAVDASREALAVARSNAERHAAPIDLRQGHWLDALRSDERFDLIVSNPPYIAMGDPHLPSLAFEPREALVSGADGLDAIREIAARSPHHLEPGGWLLLEHGSGQDAAVRALLLSAGLESVRSWPDLAGIPRVTGGQQR